MHLKFLYLSFTHCIDQSFCTVTASSKHFISLYHSFFNTIVKNLGILGFALLVYSTYSWFQLIWISLVYNTTVKR